MEWSKVAHGIDQDDHHVKDEQNMPKDIKEKAIGFILHSRHHRGCE